MDLSGPDFSNYRDPIFNSRNPNRAVKHLKKPAFNICSNFLEQNIIFIQALTASSQLPQAKKSDFCKHVATGFHLTLLIFCDT